MSPEGSHHSSRFLRLVSHKQTASFQAVGNSTAANRSLKETPRRQQLARIRPSNYAHAPCVTEKRLPQLHTLGEFVRSKEPSAGETQLLIMCRLFYRGPSEENLYLTLTLRHLTTKGQKKKRKPHKPTCTYSTKTKLRTTSTLMKD